MPPADDPESRLGTRRRRRLAAGTAALVLAAAIVVAVLATSSSPAATGGPDLGSFAGYTVQVRSVSSVSAAWTVPATVPAHRFGKASVWIGAEAVARPLTQPFIQVGIVITRGADGRSSDVGFWTDTANGYHPFSLMSVRPGDRLQTRLTRIATGWRVELRDRTSGRGTSFVTHDERSAHFTLAGWIEENPARSDAGGRPHPAPFAMTAPVHIESIEVDGRPADVGRVVSDWMSVPRATLAPTPIHDDAFTVRPVHLGPAAARYIRITLPESRAAQALRFTVLDWDHGAPPRVLAGEAASVRARLRRFGDQLQATGWPPSTAADRAALVSADRRLVSVLGAAGTLTAADRPSFKRRLSQASHGVLVADVALRRELDAPGDVPVY